MKIKLLMMGLLGLISTAALAQKGELRNAQENYDKYSVASSSGANSKLSGVLATQATTNINDAKTSIDKAATNDKTSALPETFALKGAIYAALAVRDTVPTTSAPLFATADEAVKKAKEIDTKGDNKKLIDDASRNLAQYKLTEGVKSYQLAKYDAAYKAFDYYRQAFPADTTAIYYTALAASNQGNIDPKYFPFAISNYNTLLTTNYSANAKVYGYLYNIYLTQKDTVNAAKTLAAGVAKYPASNELRKSEIEMALTTGKLNDVLGKIQTAITNDPKNKTLYFYQGLTYSEEGDAAAASAAKTKDNAAKAAFNKTANDNYVSATESYKKALEIDPEYFDANLNLGFYLMKPAIDTYNIAVNLPADKTKEYDAMRLKADTQFDLAFPYLKKAVDINPKSKDALNDLRNYYRGKYDPAHAADNKTKANDLKKQIDALPGK